MGRLTLMRHTAVAVTPGICYGRTDVPLAATFEAEAQAALDAIDPPARILTSPLQRCARLAGIAAARFDLPVQLDPRLTEMNFGTWEGRPWSLVPRDELDEWSADFMDARPHGGESVRQMQDRVTPALAALRAAGPVLVITHAGVMKVVAHLQGLPDAWRHSVPFGGTMQHG